MFKNKIFKNKKYFLLAIIYSFIYISFNRAFNHNINRDFNNLSISKSGKKAPKKKSLVVFELVDDSDEPITDNYEKRFGFFRFLDNESAEVLFSTHSFSVDDRISEIFDNCNKGDRIRIAIYELNNKKIIKSLINAANREVKITIVLNRDQDKGKEKKQLLISNLLSENRIKVKYAPQQLFKGGGNGFMHSKIVIINDDILCVGSYNLTDAANSHFENLIVFKGEEYNYLVSKHIEAFKKIYKLKSENPENRIKTQNRKRIRDSKNWVDAKGNFKAYYDSKAFFSFKHDIKGLILNLISNEKKGMKIAMFTFTDADIVNALINESRRGVKIDLLVDGKQYNNLKSMQHAVNICAANGINSQTVTQRMLHHKFIVFEENSCVNEGEPLLLNGSYNFTEAANSSHIENVIILVDPTIVDFFREEFNLLLN